MKRDESGQQRCSPLHHRRWDTYPCAGHRIQSGAALEQALLRCIHLAPNDLKGTRVNKSRRSIWLWVFVLWILGLGIIGIWRGAVLWRERTLLFDLGSSLSPLTLTLFVLLSGLCGGCLIVAALGLWWRQAWARSVARIAILSYLIIVQVYTWMYVRTGLMWERRWVSLGLAILGAGIGIGMLTWPRSRKWLGHG